MTLLDPQRRAHTLVCHHPIASLTWPFSTSLSSPFSSSRSWQVTHGLQTECTSIVSLIASINCALTSATRPWTHSSPASPHATPPHPEPMGRTQAHPMLRAVCIPHHPCWSLLFLHNCSHRTVLRWRRPSSVARRRLRKSRRRQGLHSRRDRASWPWRVTARLYCSPGSERQEFEGQGRSRRPRGWGGASRRGFRNRITLYLWYPDLLYIGCMRHHVFYANRDACCRNACLTGRRQFTMRTSPSGTGALGDLALRSVPHG
ncbi:hypothetical protein BC834DRAFT_170005 [Gloeopeniophorella convolvens]|nr:hypothetical protein BC834DRAFT_170005 [Gloeopeniophorella convolvens]